MATINELNERRQRTYERLTTLGMMNTLHDPDEKLKQAASYRLAYEAWMAAEKEFNKAIAALSPAELETLANR